MQTVSDRSHHLSLAEYRTESETWLTDLREHYGLDCELDGKRSADSHMRTWEAGPVSVLSADIHAQSVSPVTEDHDRWPGENLFIKLVSSGSVLLEQRGERQRFEAGSLVLVDPSMAFRETFPDATRLIAMRVPKRALLERGYRPQLDAMHVPDVRLADVQAVRDFMQCFADLGSSPSAPVLERFGDHLMDMMDIFVSGTGAMTRSRSSEATLFRAERFIERHFRNAYLTVADIAAAVHLSENYLSRLFKAQGTSLMRYVWSVRLEHAAHLLRTTAHHRLQVREIAYQCGFTSAAHFSRVFKHRFGMTPVDFARNGRSVD